MKREEKQVIIDSLTEQLQSYKHLYISDISGLDAAATQKLRSECFKAGVKLIQVKNTLLKVALDGLETNYEELYVALTGSSAIMLSETANVPAKLIKEFRKGADKPILKAAYVEESVYVGDNQLESLVTIKSKEELLGDIILLLQSPMQKLISSLESGKNTIGGVLKTLEDRA
ncbi:MAG: 50S ribosomal protein L10 [Culturomica sp.]|jgi:large subunit ribosomal protein L10|nr:50S ribosomal protein L10 [Culturomica sp.]